MKLPLSKRLQACCALIAPGDRVADIGCDHGYLGIYLLSNNIASYVIAADINQMPLDSAFRNAGKFGVRDRMQFCLSDGARNIPRNFDVMVCAGMGADTIISILEAVPWLKQNSYRLVLQCQSRTPVLRQYLSRHGWCITEESVLRDGRFLYTVMDVRWQPECAELSIGQSYFPPALTKKPSPELPEYYRQTVFRLQRAVSAQKENADPDQIRALAELTALSEQYPWLKENPNDNCK